MSEGNRILVTGGAGFLGSWVVERLLGRGARVDVVDDLSTGSEENLQRARARAGERLSLFVADVVDPGLGELAERRRWRVVIHLAARASLRGGQRSPVEDARVNVLGTVNAIEAARLAGARKVVFAASAAVYGDPGATVPVAEDTPHRPRTFYGASKLSGISYLAAAEVAWGLAHTSLVLANLYGPRQRAAGGAVVARFVEALAAGRPPTVVGDGAQTRDFVWVGDAADAVVAAIDHADGRVLNVSTGVETSIAELARLLAGIAGRPELAPEHAGRQLPGEVRRSALDPTRAAHLLGWRPRVPLQEGLRRTWMAALT
jgi:UDP-glucose 4-epimerase